MKDKRKQIEDFISEYDALQEQERLLKGLQDRLDNNEKVGYEGVLHVGDETFSLTSLSGLEKEKLFHNFEDELKLFITFLRSGNESKMEQLLDSVSIKQDNLERKSDISENPLKEVSKMEKIHTFLSNYGKGTVLNPASVHDLLYEEVENLSLSEVHQVCRELVEEGKMSIVHQASCYKCSSGFSKVYEVLPKTVICGDCGEDIVNIEIQYRLL